MKEWQKPSIYSVAVILGVLAFLGWLVHVGKLQATESLIGALLAIVVWMTNGARPAALDKLPSPSRDTDPDVKS